MDQLVSTYIEMSPELKLQLNKIQKNQVNNFVILQKHENFDEIKHL